MSNERRHTAGPWRVREDEAWDEIQVVQCEEGLVIGYVEIATIGQENIHDAHLIAAAPDLLAACEEFVRKCDNGEAKSRHSYAQMKAAIEKATGEQ